MPDRRASPRRAWRPSAPPARGATSWRATAATRTSTTGAALVAGAAPNLTHFASRGVFAGGIFDLWVDLDGNGEIDIDERGRSPQPRRPRGLAAGPARREADVPATGSRGMPNLNLTEEQIDALVAYLETLE